MPAPAGLVAAWRKNEEQTLSLLDAVPAKHLADRYDERTRTVAAQLAHLHNWRVDQVVRRGGRALARGPGPFERGAQPGKRELRAALVASGKAMGAFLQRCAEAGEVRSWGGPPETYLGYLITHEEHHRALAIVSLRLCGHRLPSTLTDGRWYAWRKA